jgi:rSAM/selenodomain-associated transferase 2
MKPADRLSIIIPCLNEGGIIRSLLESLQPLRRQGHQIILVDGGSQDGTCELAAPLVDLLAHSEPGRARQMNLGAAAADGEIFWFLHADSHLPADAAACVLQALAKPERCWGRFDVRLSGKSWLLHTVGELISLRSRLTGIATGDQGIFVRRHAFYAAGGFPDIPLMEDVAISRRLKRMARPCCLKERIVTSSRRWQQQGVVRTILLMWRLRLAFFLGADPAKLVRRYRLCSTPTPES